jgi:hypothetical protein
MSVVMVCGVAMSIASPFPVMGVMLILGAVVKRIFDK